MSLSRAFARLEELLLGARRIPLTGRLILDEEAVINALEAMRHALPDDLAEVDRILIEREEVLTRARQEAEAMIREAKEYAGRIQQPAAAVDRHAPGASEGEALIEQARRVAREIRLGAHDYADEVLEKLEQHLDRAIQQVRSGREELRR